MTIDPQTGDLLDQINQYAADPDSDVTIAEARIGANALFTGFSGEIDQGCTTEDRLVPSSENPVPVRIYYPGKGRPDTPLPLVVFIHGGGWSLGDVAAYDSLVRSLCVLSNMIFVSIDYRLAPEHKYPAGLQDCLAATKWVLDSRSDLDGDVDRVTIMGDSAGGNLAAIVAHHINREAPNSLKAQLLLYPVLDISQPHKAYPSRMGMGNGDYLLSREGIDQAADWYLNPQDDRSEADISPMQQDDLSPLPPTVILVGGYDPLLDEAKAYHQKLTMAEIPSTFRCYDTTIHAFLSFGILDIAHEARQYLADQLQRLLTPMP